MVSRRSSRLTCGAAGPRDSAAWTGAVDKHEISVAASKRRIFDIVFAPLVLDIARGCRCLLRDPGDLRALYAEARHQPLLIEDEGIDVLRDRGAGERLADARVDDNDARADAELPAVAPVEIGERAVVHEEEGVTEDLDAGLQPVRRRDGVIIADGPAIREEHAFTHLSAEHEAGFHHAREDEHGLGFRTEQASRGVVRIEVLERPGAFSVELRFARGQN